jgi:hypothetical protein
MASRTFLPAAIRMLRRSICILGKLAGYFCLQSGQAFRPRAATFDFAALSKVDATTEIPLRPIRAHCALQDLHGFK